MIFDIERFIARNKADWDCLKDMLESLRINGFNAFDLEKINRFYYLYHKTSSDLNRIQTFSSETELIEYLEGLVSKAYAQVYSLHRGKWRFKVKRFFLVTFPAVFKKRINYFYFSLIIMLAGGIFGGAAIILDPQAKDILIKFQHLSGSPYERVLEEETKPNKNLEGQKLTFSSYLITHNIKVALLTLTLGITFGLGTFILLFYNGIILGAVVVDYIRYGVGTFAAGWLLPHGAFEIWAILIAGQTGFLIAESMLKSGRYSSMTRLAMAGEDILVLFLGLCTLLTWAGIVEAFFSQYHKPIIPYTFKITFGIIELLFLFYYLIYKPSNTKKVSAN